MLAPDGTDLTPRSAKAQGALALLATGARLSRGRAFLQEKLWSDRAREQGAASLRQVLTELRKSLGDHADCLMTDRKTVALDPDRVDLADRPTGANAGEFLEGLDTRDREFEDWLRLQRSKYADKGTNGVTAIPSPSQQRQRRLLVINDVSGSRGMEGFFADHFGSGVARHVAEQISLQIVKEGSARPGDLDIVLRTSARISKGMAGLHVSMQQGPQGLDLWSGSELVTMNGAPPIDHEDVLRLIHETSENVSEAMYSAARMGQQGFDAAVLSRVAVRKLFSMRKSEQLSADKLLATAFDLQPRAVYLAWRVLLRVIMLVERHAGLPPDHAEEAEEMSRRAMELEPMNSMALVAASNAAVILRADNTAAREYAERSLKANPANPFAWDAMSMAALYCGNADLAHRAQMLARHIAGSTPFAHWFDMGCASTATTRGAFEDAISWACKSAAMSPSFHPPLRYLIALYARSGQLDKAIQTVERLKALEPDFSVDRLVGDDEYPVLALRRSRLLTPGLINRLT